MNKPTDEEYLDARLRLALSYCPAIEPCTGCGWPQMEGYLCNHCRPPAEPAPPDRRVEVEWDADHGWMVSEPRGDDGEMESWDLPPEVFDDADNDGRVTVKRKDAVYYGRLLAKSRQLPLRIYHKRSKKFTDVPLSRIE